MKFEKSRTKKVINGCTIDSPNPGMQREFNIMKENYLNILLTTQTTHTMNLNIHSRNTYFFKKNLKSRNRRMLISKIAS